MTKQKKSKNSPSIEVLPGINIQWPWSRLILSCEKTVETRRYNIPVKYLGKPIAIIETPGPRGKREANIQKASIIGVVIFSSAYEYTSESHWKSEFNLHKVPTNDPQYKFEKGIPRWAWVVKEVRNLSQPLPAPKKRGIVFATACSIRY
jgi:hypothetical protein